MLSELLTKIPTFSEPRITMILLFNKVLQEIQTKAELEITLPINLEFSLKVSQSKMIDQCPRESELQIPQEVKYSLDQFKNKVRERNLVDSTQE